MEFVMKLAVLVFFLIVVLSSCKIEYSETPTQAPETPTQVEVPVPLPQERHTEPNQEATKVEVSTEIDSESHEASKPVGEEYPVLNAKKVFTVAIQADNYNPQQLEKLKKAEKIIEKIFNSDDYKQEILKRTFTNTKGLTNLEIYEKLFAGAEALQPAVNYQMDLRVVMYYQRFTNVVGYTTPKSLIVNTNSKFHDNYDECKVASNLTHEWTHKMGFDHTSAGDSKSVPYSHNDIVETLCKKFR
jgi:ssRNA-specific RNase YbeY (16S rRNA maturation enzyme)